ncbi:MAG: membrane protein insertion efficiency factor YidD, partial [Gammaproteobacteria bacterium]|nr:membrane protein insertion efficiency factor YidD [Gammaproteobacteria bacterium]NIR67206.1 membrane protein insertion efficiency factor YidD [candidate division Zixibacteria bacterium]NIR94844.1 membrane protein insertion efficiency factor YidD [Gammaproteobacteria bacterium]NIS48598.1 membrane protein insertion efficiency factor YidD [candidate division Zixibacteria bacterium]NIU16669.1 membrane protein insertion efficiency factor YidD [candidate division Zixibacteria bacterium]
MRQFVLWLISRYRTMGGGRAFFGIDCNFEPSCSAYAHDAISEY